jgi:hypothetical protein
LHNISPLARLTGNNLILTGGILQILTLAHLFLTCQGSKEEDLKALTTKEESVSNHRFLQLFVVAISTTEMQITTSLGEAAY